jgi:SAM-dependent methyltransferase
VREYIVRIGTIPTTLLEWTVTRLNLAPLPAIEAVFGMLHSRALMAGVHLGVFATLEVGDASADELAIRLGLQPEGTRLLCNALVAGRYLRRDRVGRYTLRPVARRYLLASSPHYVGHYVEYNYDQWQWIGHLEDVVRSGQGLDMHHALGTGEAAGVPGSWSRYLEGLADLARDAASEIAAKVPMPERRDGSPRTLLDVGGGHGTFSVALCRRYPDLTAEILDLPDSVIAGEPIARRYAGPVVGRRVHYRAGDALVGPLAPVNSYDVVLIFQLLHHLSLADIPGLVERAIETLRPGGWIVLLDLLEPAGGRPPNATAAYAALHFHVTSYGRSYTPEQVEDWLRGAGCTTIRRTPLLRVPGQPIIAGQRPA